MQNSRAQVLSEVHIHWIVKIMMKDPNLVSKNEQLSGALGLTSTEFHDIQRHASIHHKDSYSILKSILNNWMSKRENGATMPELISILTHENFLATAKELKMALQNMDERITERTSSGELGISIWFDVPPRIHYFTGRNKELELLHKQITTPEEGGNITVITTLSGLGGIGKTSLSIQYAWTYFENDFYSSVIWINSETRASVQDSFQRLKEELKFDDNNDIKLILPKIYNLLMTRRTLIIFDNVQNYDDVKEYLPRITPKTVHPNILVTSRNQNWNDAVQVIQLDVFKDFEALEFFKSYLKLESKIQYQLASQIATVLQNLPLGIRQAGAYIKVQSRKSGLGIDVHLKNYLDQLKSESNSNSKSLLDFHHWTQTADSYQMTTYLTWNITLKEIKIQNKLAVRIMEIISYFNPDDIPIKWFLHLHLSGDWSNLKLLLFRMKQKVNEKVVEDAIDLLSKYSMILRNFEKQTFSVHRLVQHVTRLQVEESYQYLRLNESVDLIYKEIGIPSPASISSHIRNDAVDINTNYNICLLHGERMVEYIRSKGLVRKYKTFISMIEVKHYNLIAGHLKRLNEVLEEKKYSEVLELISKLKVLWESESRPEDFRIRKSVHGLITLLYDIEKLCEDEEPDLSSILEFSLERQSYIQRWSNTNMLNRTSPVDRRLAAMRRRKE